jgi:Tol biopolymer transport system component
MTNRDRTGSGAERFSTGRRSAVASLLFAVALMAGACEDPPQEASDAAPSPPPDATTGSVGATDGQPDEAGLTLIIVNVRSGEETTFAAPSGASAFDVAPDASMVAYADADEVGNAQVFVMDADGSHARQLTHGLGGAEHPDWSPDGSMIAYQRNVQIYVVSVSDGESTRVTREPGGAVDPGGWAPDGGSIVFSADSGTIYAAWSVDLTTGRTRSIVPDGSTPTLSPDGAWIAFNSWLKPRVRLILANSDGSGRRTIARFDNDDGYQQWSPDSTLIAFIGSTEEDGVGTYVYDLASGATRFVTAGTIESWIDDDHILVS